MNVSDLRIDPRQFKAITSFDVEKFDELLVYFELAWDDYIEKYLLNGKPRLNKYTPKNTEQLPSTEDKLFFILFYLKNNTLQHSLSAIFGMKQDMANKWIKILQKVLDKALVGFGACKNSKAIGYYLSDKESVIMDVTEREIPRDSYIQEEYFSGKKKSTA